MFKAFEEFLESECPCHTNNDPAGFENWLDDLDTEQLMNYADRYGNLKYLQGFDRASEVALDASKVNIK